MTQNANAKARLNALLTHEKSVLILMDRQPFQSAAEIQAGLPA